MNYLRHSVALPLCLLGTLPAPVFAQDTAQTTPQAEESQNTGPMCGGHPAQWLGGSAEASDISTSEGPLAMQLRADGDNHPYVAFRISGDSQDIRAEAQAIGGGDPSLVLSTTQGRDLAQNDDANGTLDSQLTEYMRSGDYCLQLVPVQGGSLQVNLQVSRPDMPPLIETPEDMSINSCTPTPELTALIEGDPAENLPKTITTEGGLDYLRLSLAERTALTLRAESDSLDPNMVLYGANGERIAANDDADGLNSRLDFAAGLPAGEYCLGVAPLSPGEGAIDISASVLDPSTLLQDAYRNGDLPPASNADYPIKQIDIKAEPNIVALSDGGAQWFTFDVEKQSVLIVNAYGSILGVDTKLSLFASNGATVDSNDDANDSTDAQIGPLVLTAGTYRMALTDVNNRDSSAMRPVSLVFELYEKAE